MPSLLDYTITAIIAALVGALTPILVARFSKTRRERDAEIVGDYLKLVDMTADQLEKKINEIGKLSARIGELEKKNWQQELENAELKARRDERDEKIEALEARIAALDAQIQRDVMETRALQEKYQTLKEFTGNLIDALEKSGNLPNIEIPATIKKWRWEKKNDK